MILEWFWDDLGIRLGRFLQCFYDDSGMLCGVWALYTTLTLAVPRRRIRKDGYFDGGYKAQWTHEKVGLHIINGGPLLSPVPPSEEPD